MSEQKIPDFHLILLIIGYSALAVAIVSAYMNPARFYELSIYQQTPSIFWVGISIGLTTSVILTYVSITPQGRAIALNLAALSMTIVVLLPVLRNYYYIGEGDALGHLGTALDLKVGVESVIEGLYPASHTLSVVIHYITGIEIRNGLMMLLAILFIAFILFIPLTIRLFSNDKWVVSIAVFSSLFLLPINHFTTTMHPHTTSYTIHLVPLLIYLFLVLLSTSNRSYVILLLVSMSAVILFHPQQAANIIILFGTIAILQLIIETVSSRSISSTTGRNIYSHIVSMMVVFWLWTEGLEKVSANIQRPLASFLARQEEEIGGDAQAAIPSLEIAGGSVEEIFIKMFLIGFIYCVLSSVLMTASLTELIEESSNKFYKIGKDLAFSSPLSNIMIIYLTFGFVAITGMFLFYILGNHSIQYFRHHSFMMVIITVIGSLSLGQLSKSIVRKGNQKTLLTGICVLFVAFLLLSVPVVHVSPYIYQESEHVPKSQIEGYETAFEYQDEAISFAYIRSPTYRYHTAIVGEREEISFTEAEPATPPRHFSEQGSLRSYYEEQTYLVVTSRDRTRDRNLHEGVRYTREDYEQFDEGTGIDQIHDNGGFTLYRINPLEE